MISVRQSRLIESSLIATHVRQIRSGCAEGANDEFASALEDLQGRIRGLADDGPTVTVASFARGANGADSFRYTDGNGTVATVTVDGTPVSSAPGIICAAIASVLANQTTPIDVETADDFSSAGTGFSYSLAGRGDQ